MGAWLKVAESMMPLLGLPQAGWVVIGLLVVGVIVRIVLEWQLRLTLAMIFRDAPGGSVVVIKKRGLRGSMWIRVGDGPVRAGRPGRQVELWWL